jgi:hypothetical protein
MNSEAELSLIIRAQDLAEAELDKVKAGLDGVATKARNVADKISSGFRSMSSKLSNAIGNSVENVVQGGSLDQVLFIAGAYMAGQLAEEFGLKFLERLASSALIQALVAPLAALGSAIGGLIAAAIPVGMALLPVLLVAALVAAVAFLIANPDIVAKIAAFAGDLIGSLIGFLASLPGKILDVIVGAFSFAGSIVAKVAGFVGDLIRGIIGGLVSLPGKIADVIGDAFRNLKLDIGPFHIRSTGVTIDLPNIATGDPGHFVGGKGGGYIPKYAGGGWAGLHGPELALLGEHGPEYVNRTGTGTGGGGGFTIAGVSERDILDMVDRGLYFRLQRAATGSGRF